MNVSLAQITLAHLVVFGEQHPKNETYNSVANRIVEKKPKSWQRLMRICGEVIEADRKAGNYTEYKDLVEAVKKEYNPK